MDKKTRRQLEAVGWTTGDAWDFLELTDDEAEFIEMSSRSREIFGPGASNGT